MNRLKEDYTKKYRQELKEELGIASLMAAPSLQKIVLNCGLGEAVTHPESLEEVASILALITGQKPVITKAKKAIASFKIRQGDEIGVMVTLRGDRMWDFFDKLINVTLPRTKDFHGVPAKAFDGSGNYTFGITDHIVFPEVDTNKVQKIRTFQITFVISGGEDRKSKALLTKFGFPFSKDGN